MKLELKAIQEVEDMIKNNKLSKIPKSIKIIEDNFSAFAYLKSLIDMKREGEL
tara:strand:+ start:574 stop:732 length:159 start_codon:yes stop_codon:yes gene_type:complete